MNLDVRLIEAFALIMRSGSLTKAEAVSGISKSTLSRHLQRLEQQLGVQLQVRSTRKVIPTDAGRALHVHCEALLAEMTARMEAASTEIQEMSGGDRGRLVILSDSQFSTTFVSHVTQIFLQRHPDLQCDVYLAGRADSPGIDEVDCYICEHPPDMPNLVGKLVGRLSHSLYASPAYICSAGLPSSPEHLAEHVTVRHRDVRVGSVLLHDEQRTLPYLARTVLHTNDYWMMKNFCVDGLGIALLPDFLARADVARGGLVAILPAWKPDRTRVYCAYQRQRYMGRKLREFIDLVTGSMVDIDTLKMLTLACDSDSPIDMVGA